MTVKKEGLLALVCCLILLPTSVQATEELSMAWMKGAFSQDAKIAAMVGDAFGCTYVTLDTAGDFGQDSPNLGARDVYLIKYNPDGEVMWVYQFGTEDSDLASCLTVDAQGNCFVGGQTNGSLAPNLIVDTEDALQDAFLAKISSEGTPIWIRQFGSTQSDIVHRIRLDQDDNCYVAGTTTGCIDSATEDCAGQCPFVARFDANGELVWINQVRDSNAQTGLGVGVDPNGTVALAGTPGYVATFDANGIFLESCPLEHQSLRIMDACVDDLGHVYLVGETGWWSRVIQYNFKGQEVWSLRSQENGWSNTKSIVFCLDGSQDLVTAGCQGGPSGGTSCQTFIRRYSQSGDLVAVFRSLEGYCGAKVGADSLHGAYALSALQSNHSITFIFKAQSSITIAASQYMEAESAVLQGASIETTQPDYSGEGYIHLSGNNCSIEWETDVLQAGIRTAYIRYQNPNPEPVLAIPRLNDKSIGRIVTIEFPPTGDQNEWSVVRYNLDLQSGVNTFKIIPQADSIQQGLYVDSLEIVNPGGNIAQGKTIVCSEDTEDNPAFAVLDGRLDTAWQVNTYPRSLEIDLGHAYPINQTALFCEGSGPCQFILEGKTALNDNYQLMVDNSTNTTPANLHNSVKDTFPTTNVRYLRLTVTGDVMQSVGIHELCLSIP